MTDMNWLGILGDAAGYCFALAFVIVIIVGYANGGKYRMSPWDPALLNEISPKGKQGDAYKIIRFLLAQRLS